MVRTMTTRARAVRAVSVRKVAHFAICRGDMVDSGGDGDGGDEGVEGDEEGHSWAQVESLR